MASLIFTNLFYISCGPPKDNIIVNGGPDTPLHEAVKNDDIEEVKRLLTEEGWKEVIESYSLFQREKISKTPDMNIIGHYGDLPLFFVKSLEMAKFLISKGADVNATDKSGETPLHKVSEDVSIAKLYLEHGADIEAENNDGKNPYEESKYAYYSDDMQEFLRCVYETKPKDFSTCVP